MRFVFAYEKILDLRKKERQTTETSYKIQVEKLRLEEEKLKNIFLKKEDIYNQIKNMEQSHIILNKLRSLENNFGYWDIIVVKQIERVRKVKAETEKIKEELNEKIKEEKIMQKLKENAYNKFLKEQNKKEEKANDELATIKYFSNQLKK